MLALAVILAGSVGAQPQAEPSNKAKDPQPPEANAEQLDQLIRDAFSVEDATLRDAAWEALKKQPPATYPKLLSILKDIKSDSSRV